MCVCWIQSISSEWEVCFSICLDNWKSEDYCFSIMCFIHYWEYFLVWNLHTSMSFNNFSVVMFDILYFILAKICPFSPPFSQLASYPHKLSNSVLKILNCSVFRETLKLFFTAMARFEPALSNLGEIYKHSLHSHHFW